MDRDVQRTNKAVHIALKLTDALGTSAFKRLEWIVATVAQGLHEWEIEREAFDADDNDQEGDKPSADVDVASGEVVPKS